jgi:hypothetical protein
MNFTAYTANKSYGVSITAGGVTYNFHVDRPEQVQRLINESTEVTAVEVIEQTHTHTDTTYRTMPLGEVLTIAREGVYNPTASVV